ncbi:BCCT family transporter [Candidatus Berkiella cookevillensis]|uniref:BCCT family transporter n=1 Tax=Candidatus Berkiella cookevillensis TaxID=437022 RepID=A0A0Q9YQV5_9GAMM|nr:BCCT family transporter [Candidatus Berkiella cookevillensis]MCS5708340.1 BCCT family transporter [Candidatus Berkiella cookevillensis]
MIKTYKAVNIVSSLVGVLILSWLSIFKPNLILLYSVPTSVAGYLLLLLFITPAGGIVLGDRTERLPFVAWLSKIVNANLILFIFTIAVSYAFLSAGPIFTMGALSYDFTTEIISSYTLTHWGIFPWGIYGIWGLVVAYNAYIKKGTPFLYQSVDFFPLRLQAMFKTFVESSSFITTIFAICTMAVTAILLFSYSIYQQLHFHHFLLPFISVSFLGLLLPIFALKFGKRIFRRLAKRGFGISRLMTMLMAISFPLLLLIAYANGILVAASPELFEKSKCLECIKYFNVAPVEDRFASIYWGWFLLWAPLAGSYLASISKGRTIRELVFGIMLMPAIFFISIKLLTTADIKSGMAFINQPSMLPVTFVILGLLCCWFLLIITRNTNDNSLFLSGFFKVSDKFKQDRLKVCNASRVVGLSKFGSQVAITFIMVLLMHTIAGWYIMQFQIVALAGILVTAVYWAINCIIIQFFIDKVWIGNKNIKPFRSSYVKESKPKKNRKYNLHT